ncbi:hypothetical protein ACE6H2_015556 [Prunus campanulata]
MNTIVNNLDLDGKPVDNDDLIDLILNSVSPVTTMLYANHGHDSSLPCHRVVNRGCCGDNFGSRGGFFGPSPSPSCGFLLLPCKGPNYVPFSAGRGGSSSSSYGNPIDFQGCYNYSEFGHMARRCSHPHIAPYAMVASYCPTQSQTWFTNSGSSSHVTNSGTKLSHNVGG